MKLIPFTALLASLLAGAATAQHWFDAPLLVTEPGTGQAYGVGDHDGDGDPDILHMDGHLIFPTEWHTLRVLLNDGHGRFTSGPAHAIPAGQFPFKAPIVDLTGDGLGEVLMEQGGAGNWGLVVIQGAPGGGIGPSHVLPMPSFIAAVAFGDVDGDGVQELATLHGATAFLDSDELVRWWDWNGAAFVPGPSVLLPDAAFGDGGVAGIAALDFTGDGRADLVAGETFGSDLILLPTVAGAPSVGAHIALPHSRLRPLAGDLDGDGRGDVLVVASDTPIQLIPLLQTGPGAFTVGPKSAMPFSSSSGVPRWLVDWDKDGRLDVLAHSDADSLGSPDAELLLIRNDGSHHFSLAAKVLTGRGIGGAEDGAGPADFDGDGWVDFAAVNSVAFGNGRFENVLPSLGHILGGVARVGVDWEDDGDVDLVRDTLGGFLSSGVLLLNDGAATFQNGPAPPPAPAPLNWGTVRAVGDFDGVPGLDLLVPLVDSSNPFQPAQFVEMRLVANDGFGNLVDRGAASMQEFATDSRPFLPAADLDADGDLDVLDLVGASGGYWPNQGGGTFGSFVPLFSGEPLLAQDLDQDGDTDVVGRGLSGLQLTLFRNDGPAGFTAVLILAGNFQPDAVDARDLDLDGDPDLIVGGGIAGSSNAIRLFRNDGAAGLTNVGVLISEKACDQRFGLADVDGDGVLDLLAGRSPDADFADRILAYRGLGGGFAYDPLVRFVGREIAGWADLDQDGDLDGFGLVKIESRRFDGPEDGVLRQYGASSPGTAGAKPVLGGTGPVRPGSQTASLRVRLARGGAPALFVVGTGATEIAKFGVPGFTLYVNPPLIIVPLSLAGPAGAAGQGTLDVDTSPLLAQVPGLAFYHQVAVIDPQGKSGVAYSNGLEIIYGL